MAVFERVGSAKIIVAQCDDTLLKCVGVVISPPREPADRFISSRDTVCLGNNGLITGETKRRLQGTIMHLQSFRVKPNSAWGYLGL
jgi:hypothetical protein